MTLEDQIRRMGEARAAEVSTPSWRERVGTSALGARWIVAAIAALAIVVGGVVLFTGDDPADTETADGSPPVERWIPASGVDRIEYPGALGALFLFGTATEVALVTPTSDGDPVAAEWTRVEGGSSPYRRQTRDADQFSVRDVDGVAILSLDHTDGEVNVARVSSRRFDTDELAARAPELFGISRDVHLLAKAIAAWDGSAVRYVGAPVRVDQTVTGLTDDDLVARLATQSPTHFVATFGDASTTPRYLIDLFALETADGARLNEQYFTFPVAEPPISVTEGEWLSIVEEALGTQPIVEFPGSELFGTDPGVPELDRPAAAPFVRADGHWSVRLDYPQPAVFRDGGGVDVRIGDITLTFGPADPGESFRSLAVEARMSEPEARRFAELINEFFANPAPPTTTTDGYPTTSPSTQAGVCATNPVPSDDVLDQATHLSVDRTPFDLDQDGVDDELLTYEDADGERHLLARLQDGWTNLIAVGRPAIGLMPSPTGEPAASDLDGDGQLEFFLGGYGNTARSSVMISLRGCSLEVVEPPFAAERAPVTGWIVHGVGGNSCAPTGCFPRVGCVDGRLRIEMLEPDAASRGRDDLGPADAGMTWSRTDYSLSDGALTAAGDPVLVTVSPAQRGTGLMTPDPGDTDVIDCTP